MPKYPHRTCLIPGARGDEVTMLVGLRGGYGTARGWGGHLLGHHHQRSAGFITTGNGQSSPSLMQGPSPRHNPPFRPRNAWTPPTLFLGDSTARPHLRPLSTQNDTPSPSSTTPAKLTTSKNIIKLNTLPDSSTPSDPTPLESIPPEVSQGELFENSATLSDDHDAHVFSPEMKLPKWYGAPGADLESSAEGPLVGDFGEELDLEVEMGGEVTRMENICLAPSSLPTKSMALRGVVFDVNGNAKMLDQQFKKAKFCADNTLQPRDLRKIDSTLSEQHPVILVRKKAILVNLAHIKALIKADSLILFSAPTKADNGAEDVYFHSAFVHELQGKLLTKEPLPFELRALEAIMVSVITAMQSELSVLRPEVEKLLDSIDKNPDAEFLRNLLIARRKINKFVQKIDAIRGTIKIASVVTNLATNVSTTQQMMAIILDTQRNKLIVYDLKANLATMAISSSALIAGLFGMNLPSSLDHVPYAFLSVSGGLVLLAGGVFVLALRRVSVLKAGSHRILRRSLE
ncbi:magnesium ion transporter [Dinochytrium kinnereticum]|nr:magnesium ion transporter [Dinochytrium kinnereticum]